MYFASEKIGAKFTIADWKYTRSFNPGEVYQFNGEQKWFKRPQKEKFISGIDLYVYGSGLLYNIVDLKSEKSFNYTLVGSSVGITFFNNLGVNLGIALPVTAKSQLAKKYLFNLGFDIPIFEYISALAKKNK